MSDGEGEQSCPNGSHERAHRTAAAAQASSGVVFDPGGVDGTNGGGVSSGEHLVDKVSDLSVAFLEHGAGDAQPTVDALTAPIFDLPAVVLATHQFRAPGVIAAAIPGISRNVGVAGVRHRPEIGVRRAVRAGVVQYNDLAIFLSTTAPHHDSHRGARTEVKYVQ